ncbi:hypothetical protein A0H76_138 [Hepatospora eriocheir]|uniref:Uncharacterized protein n=1 Tax=Hepatospora eriocheir TaxID=1081669 RepID=A0A1X0QJ60_9MICR|nr:hypothetical protein A0H76_138 [Hepatospora eriocheir]
MEMDEETMKYALMLKQNEDEFEDLAIDKYAIDSDDQLLPGEGRPLKINEPKLERKKKEILTKKKARAIRRANKVVGDLEIEDEKEEAVIYKKEFKNAIKKQRNKLRLVFANRRGGPTHIKRGRGKVLRLDRRMKHDLRIQKNRKK